MNAPPNIMVTGGAGFIGSALCRHLVSNGRANVLNVDKLTYAGNPHSLRDVEASPHYAFARVDIADRPAIAALLARHDIDIIMHLAAESHVDRSIDGPGVFVETNVVGTFQLLAAALEHFHSRDAAGQERFRFHHVSTDEVFGDLPFDSGIFTETTPYAPSSPYSASKAASDHFVRAWHETYRLPVVLSNCSNNYGPYHFPEKLVPLVILNAVAGKPLPVYGAGANIRDWLYVEDHARALEAVAMRGAIGQSYNIGGRAERNNLAVVEAICDILDRLKPRQDQQPYSAQIAFVSDRPGHDRRYAIDPSKIERELGWRAQESFETGLEKTVRWYLDSEWWWGPLVASHQVGERLGKARAAP